MTEEVLVFVSHHHSPEEDAKQQGSIEDQFNKAMLQPYKRFTQESLHKLINTVNLIATDDSL